MSTEFICFLVFCILGISHGVAVAIGYYMGRQGRKVKFFQGIPLNPSKDDEMKRKADEEPFRWEPEDLIDDAMNNEAAPDKPRRIPTIPGDEE